MQIFTARTFADAQDEILSSAPQHFTFAEPPSLGWWKAKFDLDLAAVAFLHHYQSELGKRPFEADGVYWQADLAARWQAATGITPRQWEGIKGNLGDGGNKLLVFKIRAVEGTKGTWIRPSNEYLAVFGMPLKIYDMVAYLDRRTGWKLNGTEGAKAAEAANKPVSDDELAALALWASRGVLPRLRCAEHLATLLAT